MPRSTPASRFLAYTLLVFISLAIIHPLIAARTPDYTADDDGSKSRKNDLTQERISAIRTAFISKEVVLRVNWMENHAIHNGQVVHYLESDDSKAAQRTKQKGGILDFGRPVASAGEVVEISGMNFMHPHEIRIFFKTNRRTTGAFTIKSKYRRKNDYAKLADSFVTVDWVGQQLETQAVSFLKDDPSDQLSTLTKGLPTARSGLQLSGSLAAPSLDPNAPKSIFPTYVDTLRARAIPETAHPGDTVQLILEYEISGDPQTPIIVDETRILSFAGKRMPGYPVSKQFARSPGDHQSIYLQKIPATAKAGRYKFEAKACANGECISRIFYFTIEN